VSIFGACGFVTTGCGLSWKKKYAPATVTKIAEMAIPSFTSVRIRKLPSSNSVKAQNQSGDLVRLHAE
jgi:hypothetical protein